MNEYYNISSCASCHSKNMTEILNYGKIPLAGNFPQKQELSTVKTYDFGVSFCNNCSLLQATHIINPDFLFKDYRYISSVGLSEHFRDVAGFLYNKFYTNDYKKIIEIGSNDGVLLKPLLGAGTRR